MYAAFSHEALQWLSHCIGTPVQNVDIVLMKGATSSTVYLIRPSSGPDAFVLRLLDNQAWLSQEPDLPDHEAAALEEAHRAGLPAPKLIAYAPNDVGFGAPALVMSFIQGSIDLQPANRSSWLDALARQLAKIHQHRAPTFAWTYRSWLATDALQPPRWTTAPQVWERAIGLVMGDPPAAEEVFLHRDYHPTNLLWQGGGVSGVVDWINACRGPAGVDVAHCRTNLALMFGPAAADQFLHCYTQAAGGFAYQPYWDADSILDFGSPQPSFYPPWQAFGLSVIPSQVLKDRLEKHLINVMMRS